MRKITLIIVSLLACCLVGCASVQGLYVDKSFTYNSIKQNNIGVGGVTSAVKPLSKSEKNTYGTAVYNAIYKRYRGQVRIMPVGDTIRALGPKEYHEMMRSYRNTGVVEDQYLEDLHKHVKRMRYMVFARIVNMDVSNNKETIYDTKSRTHYNKKEGKDVTHYHDVATGIDFSTTLSINMDMIVYDIANKTKVWSANFKNSDTNSNRLDYTSAAITRRSNNYPSVPSTSNLVARMCVRLANRFPK